MPRELMQEDRITPHDLAPLFGVTRHTVLSWMDEGYEGLKLESYRIGRKRYSTKQAAERFLAAMNGKLELTKAAL